MNRGIEVHDFERVRSWLTVKSSDPSNDASVCRYRDELSISINRIIVSLNMIKNEEALSAIWPFAHPDFKLGHHNELEKIFSKFNLGSSESDRVFVSKMILSLAQDFPKRWVHIDPNMSLEEMQMLVMVACYCETNEQRVNDNVRGTNVNVDTDGDDFVKSVFCPIPSSEVEKANQLVEKSKRN